MNTSITLRQVACGLFFLLVAAFVSGCAGTQTRYSSNLVEYLYPAKDKETVEATVAPARVQVPFKMGIAFIPDVTSVQKGPARSSQMLSEKQKNDLMGQLSSLFKQYPFVKEVNLIPAQYMVSKGSFENLDQLRNLYGVDIVALLSYDQVQNTDEGVMSSLYWTGIGAYVVKGEKNDTSTMIDAAVFHIPDHRMLFRAAGTSHVSASSTPVNLSEQLRLDSYSGFQQAIANLETNLKTQIEQFQSTLANPQP